MKTTISKLWKSIKRNPVINGFVIAVATQVWADFRANQIDFSHILGYVSALLVGVAVRQFTTPQKEHLEMITKMARDSHERSARSFMAGNAYPKNLLGEGENID